MYIQHVYSVKQTPEIKTPVTDPGTDYQYATPSYKHQNRNFWQTTAQAYYIQPGLQNIFSDPVPYCEVIFKKTPSVYREIQQTVLVFLV